jgi:hypothetical protein
MKQFYSFAIVCSIVAILTIIAGLNSANSLKQELQTTKDKLESAQAQVNTITFQRDNFKKVAILLQLNNLCWEDSFRHTLLDKDAKCGAANSRLSISKTTCFYPIPCEFK